MVQENNQKSVVLKNSLIYMLFAFGSILIIVGIYLSTYTIQQVQPYLMVGIVALSFALGFFGLAFYHIKKAV